MKEWPHQIFGIEATQSAIDAGERRICLTSPTGGGKSLIISRLLQWASAREWPAVLYTNRKLLTEQMIRVLTAQGIKFGVRAAGFADYENLDAMIQIASLQTENARVFKSQKWLIHLSKLAIFDEAHLQKGGMAQRQMETHGGHDCAIVGTTATPIGVSDIYSKLIVAGKTSELRACKALVPCMVHAGPELDTRNLKRQPTGEFSLGEIIKKIWTPTIYGMVIDEWKKVNPDARPAILFGPGVAESAWFAKEFERRGVPAAHIDGDDVYVDGKTYSASREAKDEVLARFKANEIKVLCNRFVLREGVDIPECYQGILATPIGSVVSYVQIVGRILRAHPDTPEVILTDHGGNYYRHGSPNADRDWESCWQMTDYQIVSRRIEAMREKKEPEPIVCPECGAVRMKGPSCYQCGHRHDKSVRMVIQKSGRLAPMTGDIFKPRVTSMKSDTQKQWDQAYWRAKKSKNGMTFKQAEGLFYREHHYWPPHTLANMPTDPHDWDRRVAAVTVDHLIRQPQEVGAA